MIKLKQLLAPPTFQDPEKTRVAHLLNIILFSVAIIATGLITLAGIAGVPDFRSLWVGAGIVVAVLILHFVMRQGHVRLAAILLSVLFLAASTLLVYLSGSIRAPITTVYIIGIVIAGLLVSNRAAVIFTILSGLSLYALLQVELAGALPLVPPVVGLVQWLVYMSTFSFTVVLVSLTIRNINEAFSRARKNEETLSQTVAKLQTTTQQLRTENKERQRVEATLQEYKTHLEGQVANRTADLAASNTRLLNEIATREQAEAERERLLVSEHELRLQAETLSEVTLALTSITHLTAILDEVLRQTQRLIPYQTAHIVLLENQNLRIARWKGYTEAGSEALISQLVQPLTDFPLDAAVVASRQALVIPNTRQEPRWVVQPETAWVQSHLVVPICLQDAVIGLIRLDGNTPDQFSNAHAQKLVALSAAVAIALENSRLIEAGQQRSAELAVARDQALEGSRLKTELLGRVSHELRTPLGTIIGFTEMLQEQVYGPLSNEQLEVTNKVLVSAKELTTIVNDLLDQAHLMAGKIQLQKLPFTPPELLERLHFTLHHKAAQKGLTLACIVDPALPKIINGDPERLHQILLNLTHNAIKFTEQGSITISALKQSQDYWALQVTDTGLGIPAAAQPLVFDAFQQVDGSATRRYGGPGLGLSIVAQLVSLMGGKISLDSQVGQGSTFTVILPLQPVAK